MLVGKMRASHHSSEEGKDSIVNSFPQLNNIFTGIYFATVSNTTGAKKQKEAVKMKAAFQRTVHKGRHGKVHGLEFSLYNSKLYTTHTQPSLHTHEEDRHREGGGTENSTQSIVQYLAGKCPVYRGPVLILVSTRK